MLATSGIAQDGWAREACEGHAAVGGSPALPSLFQPTSLMHAACGALFDHVWCGVSVVLVCLWCGVV